MKLGYLFKAIVQQFLRLFKLKLSSVGPYSIFDFESFLYRHLVVHKSLTFLQIGANDGVMNDPLYKFNIENKNVVSGFVLEPLPDMFNQLVYNYKECTGIKAFNLAIHSTKSEMILHRVNPAYAKRIPEYARGIASFDPNHWKKTMLVPDIKYMEEIKVKCISMDDFLNHNKIRNLDLLLVDTEGYDYEILMSLNYKKIKPKMIRFEHGIRNQVMSINQFNKLTKHLNSFGYQIIAESYDATAYLLDPADFVF